jgi:hypothetical protein
MSPSLLSHAAQNTLVGIAEISDPQTAQILTDTALEAAKLRQVLDQLLTDLSSNDPAHAHARLQTLLEPIHAYEQAYARFVAAQAAVNQALASVNPLLSSINPADLPHLHSNASAVAAAFDELAEASQALAALQTD